MPFPQINSSFETFLEPTRIFLFGKPFSTLKYDPVPMSGGVDATARATSTTREFKDFTVTESAQAALKADKPTEAELPMPPGPVERALREVEEEGIFARIYGFSFEGHYYKMPRPVLFLVQGEGHSRKPEEVVTNGVRDFATSFTGIEGKDWQFGSDILVWVVDKQDIAVCLDLEIGRYEQVLLESLVAAQEDGASVGSNSGVSRNAASFRGKGWGAHQDR